MPRTALLISRAFYPRNVAGSHRAAKLAKYLPAFGWVPTVLCADWTLENAGQFFDPSLAGEGEICETIRVPCERPARTKIGRAVRQFEAAWLPYRAPVPFSRRMLAAAENLLSERTFDVIWSTYQPGLDHYVASRIARRRHIPWVADFRDLPDQTSQNREARRYVRAEMKACRYADALVAVSLRHVQMLRSRYKAPVHLIYNGFDPQDYPSGECVNSTSFIIGFFGTLYIDRDPRPLFVALDLLRQDRCVNLNDFSVRFYGPQRKHVNTLLKGFRCGDVVRCPGRAHYDETIRLQQRCAVLLMLKSKGTQGGLTSKLFGYLAAERPILNVPGDGDGDGVDGILAETGAGRSAAEPAEIARVLTDWYRQWKTTGTVRCTTAPQAVARYSRKCQAGQLAKVFDSLTTHCTKVIGVG